MARIRSEQEYEAKREAYLKAAWQLLLNEGFDSLSINRLIEHTESSKGAFYHYFTSKDQIMEAVIDWSLKTALVTTVLNFIYFFILAFFARPRI